METVYPQVRPLRRFRSHVSELKLFNLAVGRDSRNRCLPSVFGSATGRTLFSTAQHIWQVPAELRGLITPPEGCGISILDWKAQEYAITAVESGDERMISLPVRRPAHGVWPRRRPGSVRRHRCHAP